MKTLGERIKEIRESLGLTQEDLAKRLKIKTGSTIAQYEANRSKPSLEILTKIADICGTTTDYLLGRTDENKSNEIKFIARAYEELPEEKRQKVLRYLKFFIEEERNS